MGGQPNEPPLMFQVVRVCGAGAQAHGHLAWVAESIALRGVFEGVDDGMIVHQGEQGMFIVNVFGMQPVKSTTWFIRHSTWHTIFSSK